MTTRFTYHFFPVGQGLFAAGHLEKLNEPRDQFNWVYDCGSSSPQTLVKNGIEALGNRVSGKDKKKLDLVTLSHFDDDHISGICLLLGKFHIGTLMLPYMPLAQRLLVAFEEKIDDEYNFSLNFFLDPVDFLLGRSEFGIDRILFIPPSGKTFVGNKEQIGNPEGSSDFSLDYQTTSPATEEEKKMVEVGSQHRWKARVDFLQRGSNLMCTKYDWEFVPYNNDPETPITPAFIKVVEERKSALLNADADSRRGALDDLRHAYDKQFGKSSKQRNVISLFQFGGPLANRRKAKSSDPSERPIMIYCGLRYSDFIFPCIDVSSSKKASILYSGDGYLDSTARLNRLLKFLSPERVKAIGIFQVMHHGSKTSWHPGVAQAIAPSVSVFSSDPTRGRLPHPHAAVARDFLPFGAMLVDKKSDFTALGFM